MSETPSSQPIFELSDVAYAVDGKTLLSGIDLSVRERRVGIVGRNGSGKTTLARILAGLVTPDQGRVTVCGTDVAKDRKAAIRTVGILFQNPDHQIIFPTVEEELSFGLLQIGMSKEAAAQRVLDVLSDFDKQHWLDAATHQLSQGQKQLVCLMAIIAMKPKVVILDEPYAGLDIPTRAQLTRYFDRIDAAIVHISHDPDSLRSFERVIWIDAGCVFRSGPADAVLTAFTDQMNALGGQDDISDLSR